jgi:8-oxo-dGTP diphosphatase
MYTPPVLTVDGLIFRFREGKLELLLIKRRNEPFAGELALPGGYVAEGQTTTEALDKVLSRKTGLNLGQLKYLEQLYSFDTVARDPRGHAVSVTYYGVSSGGKPSPAASTENPAFFAVENLPPLAFDHKQIVNYAMERLASKLTYTNIAAAFMPSRFTLSQLQTLYEQIAGHPLDKRNFRKQIKSQALVSETDEWFSEGRHRPARFYKFSRQKIGPLQA